MKPGLSTFIFNGLLYNNPCNPFSFVPASRFQILFCYPSIAALSSSSSTPCIEGQVCLVQTTTVTAFNTGRIEVCRNGTWGTFATDTIATPWSEKNAQVACRQAGFSGAINSIVPITYVYNTVFMCIQAIVLYTCTNVCPN